MNSPKISFIVPAYNEEHHLPQLLDSIKQYVPGSYTYEIIVADHGSQDNTIKIAEKYRTKVVTTGKGTVAGLRNLAANTAKGDVLIFLDADILLTEAWSRNFPETADLLLHNPGTVTGSVCGIPEDPNLIEYYWFKPLLAKSVRYINSGHLITTKKLFDNLSGFNENLQTGEDYDFSVRAKKIGATIVNNPNLYVIHKGYPDTLMRFIRREIWHGKGDCRTLGSMLHSPVVLVSMLFAALHLFSIGSFLVFSNSRLWIVGVIAIILLCVMSALIKHRQKRIDGLIVSSFLYYLYFSARAFSCIQMLISPTPPKRHSRLGTVDGD